MKRINGEMMPVTNAFPPVGKWCLLLLKDGSLISGIRSRYQDVTIRGDEIFGTPDRTIKGADQFSTGGSKTWNVSEVTSAILLDDIWLS